MPKTKISDYSSTASNNTDVDGINIAEGMAPSNVNNAMREIMAHLKDWQAGNVAQDMKVDGAFTCTGNAVLSADVSVGDDLTVTGDATVGGGFTCTGAAILSSNLSVAGTSSLGAVTFSGAVIMSSTLAANGNVTVGTSTTNSHTLNGNLTVGSSTSNTLTLNTLLSSGGSTGVSGLLLKSRGTSNTPEWGTGIASGTSTTATGTQVNFLLSADIAPYVKRITVMFNGVSTNGTTSIQVQIGDSGGIETSSYLGAANTFATSPDPTTYSAGFLVTEGAITASWVVYGVMTLVNVSGNTWAESHTIGVTGVPATSFGGGTKTLSDMLTQIRITTVNGTDTFDAGTINILYE